MNFSTVTSAFFLVGYLVAVPILRATGNNGMLVDTFSSWVPATMFANTAMALTSSIKDKLFGLRDFLMVGAVGTIFAIVEATQHLVADYGQMNDVYAGYLGSLLGVGTARFIQWHTKNYAKIPPLPTQRIDAVMKQKTPPFHKYFASFNEKFSNAKPIEVEGSPGIAEGISVKTEFGSIAVYPKPGNTEIVIAYNKVKREDLPKVYAALAKLTGDYYDISLKDGNPGFLGRLVNSRPDTVATITFKSVYGESLENEALADFTKQVEQTSIEALNP